MATVYLAMDSATGLTLPRGRIAGLSDSVQGLRDAGFTTSPYSGTRLTTIDDAAANWNSDVEPGWFLFTRTSATNFTLGQSRPLTDLDDLRQAIRDFQSQVVVWSANLNARGVGQPIAKIDQGHNRLYSGLAATYLICNNNTDHTLDQRKQYATLMRFGAADITKVDDFYTEDTGTFNPPPNRGDSGDWFTWVNISANPIARVNLVNSVSVTGTIAASVNLLGNWFEDITS